MLDEKRIVSFLIFWAVFRPSPDKLFGMFTGRIIDVVQVIFLSVLWILLLFKKRTLIDPDAVFFLFYIMIILQLFSFLRSSILFNSHYGKRDLYELLRYPFFYLTYGLVYQINIHENDLKKYIFKPITICFIIEYALVFLYFLNVFNFRDLWSLIYFVKFRTPEGTFQNSNWFGLFLNFSFAFFMSKVLYNDNVLKSIILILVGITILIYTESRSSLISLIVLNVFFISKFILSLFSSKRIILKNIKLILFIWVVITFIFIFSVKYLPEYELTARQYESKKLTEIFGLKERIEQSRYLSGYVWNKSLFFGFGSGKYTIADVIDNNYVVWFLRYGLIGLLLHLILFSYIFIRVILIERNSDNRDLRIFCLFFQGCIVALVIMMFSGNFIEAPQIATFFFAICAVSGKFSKSLTKKIEG